MVGGKFHFEVKLKKIYQKIIGVIIIFSVFCIFMTEELLFGSNFLLGNPTSLLIYQTRRGVSKEKSLTQMIKPTKCKSTSIKKKIKTQLFFKAKGKICSKILSFLPTALKKKRRRG